LHLCGALVPGFHKRSQNLVGLAELRPGGQLTSLFQRLQVIPAFVGLGLQGLPLRRRGKLFAGPRKLPCSAFHVVARKALPYAGSECGQRLGVLHAR